MLNTMVMYKTKNAIASNTISDLMQLVTDVDIYSYYIGNFKVGTLYNSPLRKDNNPSFAIFIGREGNLMFKDHGIGEAGNAIKFIKLIKGIRTEEELERELLRIIRRMNPNRDIRTPTRIVNHEPVKIGIARQPYTDVDKKFWKQFHISLDTLKHFNVFSIKYFLCNNMVRGIYKNHDPIYAYKVRDKFKIYKPLGSKYTKWRTNLTEECIQGYEQIYNKSGNILIITKSLKDVMCLYELGIDAIAASSETVFIPKNILNRLRSKWNHILILYDRDPTGMQKARKYSKQYKLDAFFIHKRFKAKDISDAIHDNSFVEVKEWLTKTLSRYGDERLS